MIRSTLLRYSTPDVRLFFSITAFHDRDRVEPICKKQLQDWGIDYFDLYHIHFPISLEYVDPSVRYPPGFTYDGKGEIRPGKATIQETWEGMESLVEKGLAKSIGISNFQGSLILDLLRYAKIRPAVLQIEHHPYLVQEKLRQLAEGEGLAMTAYSSFGPQSFVEMELKKALNVPMLFENPTVKQIAEKHGKTPAQVLLRWSTQRGIAVIPKSNNPDRLQQNLHVNDFDLAKEDLQQISGLDQHLRFNDPMDVSVSLLSLLASLFSSSLLCSRTLSSSMMTSFSPTIRRDETCLC